MTNTEKFLSELRTSAWCTSGARFNASRRLRRRDWFAMFSIAIFSAIGIGLAIVQKTYAFEAGTPIDNYVTALSVCIGLFVIVISLIEWGASGLVKASALYRSAEDLNRFQRKVAQLLAGSADGQALGTEEATLLRTEYEDIKMQCHYNHEPVDYQLFVANYRLSPEFLDKAGRPRMSWVRANWTKIFSYMNVGWYFGVFWIVIALLLSMTLWIAA